MGVVQKKGIRLKLVEREGSIGVRSNHSDCITCD